MKLRTLVLAGAAVLALLASLPPWQAVADDSSGPGTDAYVQELMQWRQRRLKALRNPDGYLAQVGLEWLQQGENRLGSTPSSTVHIPGGPGDWGTVYLDGDSIRYVPPPGAPITVDGATVSETHLLADIQGRPTVVQSGDLSFYVIFRESYALRIKDRHSPDLENFHGVEYFPIRPDWRIAARFIPAAPGETVEIGNVLGQVDQVPVYGTFEFEREGRTHRLIGLGEDGSDSVWFIFADKTSGHETYGAGRFLYSEGMPEDGRLVVDFNKAYNPPCAFNDYSTCPLPPQANRLQVAVTAGEKKYHD